MRSGRENMINQLTRRIPIAYRPWLEEHLDKLENIGVIETVQNYDYVLINAK